jgi:cobalt-zinc-cadmium resistance protein CzcA
MLDRIIHFSIHNKLVIAIFTLALIIWGSYSVTQLPIDAVPDITNNQVQVITVAPSLAAQELERLITFPIEQSLATIPDQVEMRSFSRFGLSLVTVVFKENVDIYWARQQVSERLKEAQTQIPPGIGIPELTPVTTGLGEIYQYIIRPKKGYESRYSAMELRSVQDWIVRRQLLGTPGVADVSSFGGFLKQYEIALDPEKLRSLHLTVAEVFNALEKNNQNAGGAYIESKAGPSDAAHSYYIRSEGLVTSLDDIRNIVVRNHPSGIPTLIRDVAEVGYGHAIRYGALTHNNGGEVVGAVVLMLKGENSSKVIRAVKERVKTIEKTLPEGLTIEPFLDRTKLVNNAIATVIRNLAEGALIVILVLVLLLGNFRAGLVVASVIPLSMLFAIAMMNLFGVSGNLMSLGAIDFGLIVDGAVIIVEAVLYSIVLKQYAHVLNQTEMDREVYEASSRIRHSATFGEIIILIVYLPILALVGTEGKMFRPMAQTVSFAILGAFILSLTYVPMMSALFLSKQPSPSHESGLYGRLLAKLQRVYQPMIEWALRKKGIVIASSLLLFTASLLLFSRLGGEFIPTLDEGDFAVETTLLPGSSLNQTVEVFGKAGEILLRVFPEVKEVVGKIGSSEIPVDPMPVNNGDMIVTLKDRREWTTAHTREELAEKMNEALSAIPGVTFGFQQPIQMRFNELATGARQDVVLKIFGEDLDVLAREANRIGNLVRKTAGATDLYVERVTGLLQIVVHYDRAKIAQYGLNISDINRLIQTGFAGETAGMVYEGDRRYDLVVRLASGHRRSIEDVQNLYIPLPASSRTDGLHTTDNQIPLGQVATVALEPGPIQIQRSDARRRITIGFNVRNRDVESVVNELREKVEKQIKLPAGYYVTYGGQFQNLIEARERLSVAVPAALLLIFVLLYFTFYSVRQGLLIFTAIPLAAIGGVLALWLRGMPFSISAGVGFIALFGVSVLNGIVLIGQFNQLRKEGMKSLKEVVLKGTAVRLRPVIMTAMVASLGFLPMALSNTSGAEVQKPLATVVIGGLVSSTLLTLFLLPVLYILTERWAEQNALRKRRVALSKAEKGNPILPVLLLLMAGTGLAQAQTPAGQPVNNSLSNQHITLDQALETALRNNAGIRAGQYGIEQQRSLRKATSDLGNTTLTYTGGQYNSIYSDNQFNLSQTLPFPTTLARQGALARSRVQSAELQLAVTRNELIFQVKAAYYQLAYHHARQSLLQRQDSLYANFARASGLRYKTGESNLLEKATAESALYEVRTLLTQNEADIRIYQSQLQTLLNAAEPITIAEVGLSKQPFRTDTLSPANEAPATQPNLALARQQVEVNRRNQEWERSRLMPEIMLGYFNQSLIGFQNTSGYAGATERYFDGRTRFTGFSAGISFPLWFRPQAARIQAAGLGRRVAQAQAELAQKNWQGQYNQAIQQYQKYQQSVDYYEQNALPQAEFILQNAQKAFRGGDIGYVEYLQGLNRALSIQTTYLDILNQHNQAVIELEFLRGEE